MHGPYPTPTDTVERIVYDALLAKGVWFAIRGEPWNRTGLMFYVPNHDISISVHEDLCTEAESALRQDNVIVIVGRRAATIFAEAILK